MKQPSFAEDLNLSEILDKFKELDKQCDILLFKIHKDKMLKAMKEKDVIKPR